MSTGYQYHLNLVDLQQYNLRGSWGRSWGSCAPVECFWFNCYVAYYVVVDVVRERQKCYCFILFKEQH